MQSKDKNRAQEEGCAELARYLVSKVPLSMPGHLVGSASAVTITTGSPSPCAGLQAICFPIATNVMQVDGQYVDIYVVHCPYGPPCLLLE